MKVAILVTHLLGTGHLARAARIGDGLHEAGHDVLLLSGGLPAPNAAPRHARMHQLPPLRADGPGYKALHTPQGVVAEADYLRRRSDEVAEHVAAFRPDILVTELFPLGRRKLSAEFIAAIETARSVNPDSLIYASLRDVLELPRKPGRKEEGEAWLAAHFDGALLHGSDAFIPLSRSWHLPEALDALVEETGYVGSADIPEAASHGEVIVSAGGGEAGGALFKACIDAAKVDSAHWRVLVGGQHREDRIAALKAHAGSAQGLTIEPVRPDFRALLRGSDVAVLQCGYNTALDVVAAGCRTVFSPFEESGGETEQLLRATVFQERFGTGLVREAELSGERVLAEVQAQRAAPNPDYSAVSLQGVARSIEILERAFAKKT